MDIGDELVGGALVDSIRPERNPFREKAAFFQ
jgi:hypothetical protein